MVGTSARQVLVFDVRRWACAFVGLWGCCVGMGDKVAGKPPWLNAGPCRPRL